jgi:hypothetical protein
MKAEEKQSRVERERVKGEGRRGESKNVKYLKRWLKTVR